MTTSDENSFLKALRGGKSTQPKLRKLGPEAEFWRDKYVTLHAEMEQFKLRVERNAEQRLNDEKGDLLRAMLPVADNLELALHHSADDDPLRQGIELTLKAFRAAMSAQGVEPIAAAGEMFDPTRHEAVGTMPDTAAPGTVVRVEQSGYAWNGVVLRPARVIVAGG